MGGGGLKVLRISGIQQKHFLIFFILKENKMLKIPPLQTIYFIDYKASKILLSDQHFKEYCNRENFTGGGVRSGKIYIDYGRHGVFRRHLFWSGNFEILLVWQNALSRPWVNHFQSFGSFRTSDTFSIIKLTTYWYRRVFMK